MYIFFLGVSSSINEKKRDEKRKKKMLVQKLGGLLPNCIAIGSNCIARWWF